MLLDRCVALKLLLLLLNRLNTCMAKATLLGIYERKWRVGPENFHHVFPQSYINYGTYTDDSNISKRG